MVYHCAFPRDSFFGSLHYCLRRIQRSRIFPSFFARFLLFGNSGVYRKSFDFTAFPVFVRNSTLKTFLAFLQNFFARLLNFLSLFSLHNSTGIVAFSFILHNFGFRCFLRDFQVFSCPFLAFSVQLCTGHLS